MMNGRTRVLLLASTALLMGSLAGAQTQVKPRVLLMVDTSGSMTSGFTTGNTGGDGSTYYHDAVLTRDFSAGDKNLSLYVGHMLAPISCAAPPATFSSYDGGNSRLFAAKAAVGNVLNASGNVDWGLMRYTGTDCPIVSVGFSNDTSALANLNIPEPFGRCTKNSDCSNGKTCDTSNHRCHCNTASLALDCPYAGTWTCSAATNGYCTPSNNGACGTWGNRSGGICVCHSNGVCSSGLGGRCSGNDYCDCTGGGTDSCAGVSANTACVANGPRTCQCLNGTAPNGSGSCTCASAANCGGGETCPSGICGIATNPFTPRGGSSCTTDNNCNSGEFCVGGVCGTDANLCWINGSNGYQLTDNRGGSCANHQIPFTYNGSCGTGATGGVGTECGTPQVCYTDADCNNSTGGSCVALAGSSAKACGCNGNGPGNCAGNYTCDTGIDYCVYRLNCQSVGGVVLVDPSTQPSSAVFEYVNNRQDYTPNGGRPTDNELRAVGATPLAGAARSATTWYNNVVDAQKTCRPYVLVQLTDGDDTCDDNDSDGTVSAAASFVAATVPNARVLNKVYVGGLAFAAGNRTKLDNIAHAGGTGSARLANTHADIQAALADIVSSSVLVEKCNNSDDDCNLACDEPFPDVLVNGAGCTNPHAAKVCSNGGLAGTHCLASGVFVCSADQLSQMCSAPVCHGGSGATLTKAGNTMTMTGLSGLSAGDVGRVITITAATNAANRGNFTILTVTGSTQVTFTNASGVAQAGGVTWNIYCANMETSLGCNGADDDCNGVIDDCTPFVANSCCTSMCPPCNVSGVPQPETCNGCDDDCNGTVDDVANLIDDDLPCGDNTGICTPGLTKCCGNPGVLDQTCTALNPVNNPAPPGAPTNNNGLKCIGGVRPSTEVCNGVDDDCNGLTDEVTQACFPFAAPAMPGNGPCVSGSQACTAVSCGVAPNACCPGGVGGPTPAGKACPGPSMFGACNGAVGPTAESCDGVDQDCNGVKDNTPLTDPWVGTACCPTGNNGDCTNTGGSTRCMLGAYQCQNGAKTCVGGVAKSAEICDGIDNDCNGMVDDVLGKGAPCTMATGGGTIINIGKCFAKFTCNGTFNPLGPNGLSCTQQVMPTAELCNGQDDDCNGTIDDNLMDPLVGVKGGSPCSPLVPPADKPPCDPGTTACVNGMVVCQGAVGPQPNLCDGISRDCTGMPNMNGNCPTGFMCFQGNCVQQCTGGEFPCPGGFVCQQSTNLCIPDGCAKLNCMPGFICTVDNNGMAACIDPCVTVSCPTGYVCKLGACVENSCKTLGCPAGELCVGTPGMCVKDPCFGVMCGPNEFCNAQGVCERQCIGPCPPGTVCMMGTCTDNPCANKQCAPGEVCVAAQGAATCVTNMCLVTGCTGAMACCQGSCHDDPCALVQCPADAKCTVESSTCAATCQQAPAGPTDEIVGAGGGGFACDASGRGAPSGALWALLLLALTLWRRALPHRRENR